MKIIFVLKNCEDENLGVMYLSRMLTSAGHETSVVAAREKAISKALEKEPGAIVAFSTLAYYASSYMNLAARIKKKNSCITVFGGPHPTALPEIIEKEGVDIVCIGEGEYSLCELANRLQDKRAITNISGLWVKEKGRVYRNPVREVIRNLDAIAFPDRTLFKQKAPFFRRRINVITSRGCTYSCPYCYNSTLRRIYGDVNNVYRRRSVDNVIAEIQDARKHQPVEFVLFHDDIFTLMPEWLDEFAVKYSSHVRVPFSCNIRIDTVTPHIVDALKKAGCHSVSFGLETANHLIRKSKLQREMENETIIQNVRILKRAGFIVRTTNIIGVSEQYKDDFETVRFNIDCGVNLAKVSLLTPYPNTDLGHTNSNASSGWGKDGDCLAPLFSCMFGLLSKNLRLRFDRKLRLFEHTAQYYKNKKEKRIRKNMHILFPLFVQFPFTFRLGKVLVRLPLSKTYALLHFLWDVYATINIVYKRDKKKTPFSTITNRKKRKTKHQLIGNHLL